MANDRVKTSILNRVRDRVASEDDWQVLYKLVGPIIHRKSRQMGLDYEEAQDLVQNMFRDLLTGKKKFYPLEGSSPFVKWLLTCTHNAVIDHRRHCNRNPALGRGGTSRLERLQDVPAPRTGPVRESAEYSHFVITVIPDLCREAEEELVSKHGRKIVEQVKSEFEVTTWRAFLLSKVYKAQAPDIAHHLGMDPTKLAAVYKAVSKVGIRFNQIVAGNSSRSRRAL